MKIYIIIVCVRCVDS